MKGIFPQLNSSQLNSYKYKLNGKSGSLIIILWGHLLLSELTSLPCVSVPNVISPCLESNSFTLFSIIVLLFTIFLSNQKSVLHSYKVSKTLTSKLKVMSNLKYIEYHLLQILIKF